VFDIDKGSLPFGDQAFDAVTMTMVLEHVFNPFHALREIWRVSKSDAQVIIGAPNLAGIRHRWTLLRGKLPVTSAWFSFDEDAWDGYHLHNFTKGSLTWLLRREGLKPLRWASQGRFQFLKRLSPSFFGADFVVLCCKAEPEPNLPARF
jgi:SAM-dependent methyltransferase